MNLNSICFCFGGSVIGPPPSGEEPMFFIREQFCLTPYAVWRHIGSATEKIVDHADLTIRRDFRLNHSEAERTGFAGKPDAANACENQRTPTKRFCKPSVLGSNPRTGSVLPREFASYGK